MKKIIGFASICVVAASLALPALAVSDTVPGYLGAAKASVAAHPQAQDAPMMLAMPTDCTEAGGKVVVNKAGDWSCVSPTRRHSRKAPRRKG